MSDLSHLAGHIGFMTQARWDRLTEAQRDQLRSTSGLSPQLIGLEGWRVEVVNTYGTRKRFIVGRSSGWMPCHIELKRRDSHGGCGTDREFKSVQKLYFAREFSR